ncbi:MAG: O-antigen ligase family protein [Bacteroidales bacterium]|nr:O-antigen ligase family protein [Bacteroidales bacterium]
MQDPFTSKTGAYRISYPLVSFLLFLSLVGVGYFIADMGIIAVAALLILPFGFFFLVKIFENPVYSFFSVYIANFTVLGINRYIMDAPLGLTVDALLALTYVTVFFHYFYKQFDWSKLNNMVVIAAVIWASYGILQLFNPIVVSRFAWLYSARGASLYMLLTVMLVFILMDKYKYFKTFLYLWAFFEMAGALKAMVQIYVGLDPYEKYWLNVVGYSTHVMFGQLRAFSFFTDAGQFGASQAHTAMVAAIIVISTKSNMERVFFFLTAVLCFWGMLLSGTRGVWGVIGGAGAFYLATTRNYRLFIFGAISGILVFSFFRYTYIGSGIYFVNRMRTAFDPKNPSLIMRLENRAKLRPYLATRPFGGGIGNAGTKAKVYAPNAFLSNIATDSWYVEIWAEQGVVGLALHLALVSMILIKGSYISMFRIRDPALQGKMAAILSGIFGIMVSSYGNGVFGQMPTGLVVYSCMAFAFMGPQFDAEIQEKTLKK